MLSAADFFCNVYTFNQRQKEKEKQGTEIRSILQSSVWILDIQGLPTTTVLFETVYNCIVFLGEKYYTKNWS